ncbi:RNA polymerase sigma factor, partial [Patulibacter sp. S7RM1-6]
MPSAVSSPPNEPGREPRPRPAPVAPRPDASLVRAAARGDAPAFEELFLRHRAAVHGYALRMLRDHGRAEDVVQEVFVSAMRAIRDGREPEHVRAWLQEVARRACIDQWRGVARRGEVSLDAPDGLRAGDADRLTGEHLALVGVDHQRRAHHDHAQVERASLRGHRDRQRER